MDDIQGSFDLRRYPWLNASIKMTIATSVFLLLPSYLETITTQFNASQQAMTRLATIELLGFAIAPFLYLLIQKTSLLVINERTTIVALALFHVTSAYCQDIAYFYGLRVGAGICAGLITMFTYDALSKLDRPSAAFGKAIATQMIFSAAAFFIMPSLTSQFGVQAFFLLLAILSALLYALPRLPKVHVSNDDLGSKPSTPLFVVCLLALFVFLMTHSATWASLNQISASINITGQQQGNILALGTIFSLIGASSSVYVSNISHRLARVVLFSAISAQVLCIAALFNINGVVGYIVSVSTFMFLWNLILPLLMGAITDADHSGTTIRFAVTAQTVGAAFGPSILIEGWGMVQLIGFLVINMGLIYALINYPHRSHTQQT